MSRRGGQFSHVYIFFVIQGLQSHNLFWSLATTVENCIAERKLVIDVA